MVRSNNLFFTVVFVLFCFVCVLFFFFLFSAFCGVEWNDCGGNVYLALF